MIELKPTDINIYMYMYTSSGRPIAVSQKVDLIEQNQCDIRTQNTKISLNQLRNPWRFFGCYPV